LDTKIILFCGVIEQELAKVASLVEARGGAVGRGTALQAGTVAGSLPDGVTGIFH
jgi:hypothetical protein